ncbi:TrbG/VirB9 family P-type conjugative transfer protein [Aquincola sp. J276]|uniref:TrbG/VirB9 family P-type conjugative transfer protein n=1 Tax=Aquincola sp. J276 TaxID=2898432 RepID=UPI002150A97D|nr:TrbG/VirB9 family P-type conjugative transfer protein [Aquincola sp. J276]MCR5864102.1 TrbG/VirB9 family P-type conjugative transfer protein [Aquincola sp. J276]
MTALRATLLAALWAGLIPPATADPRLRDVFYDPQAVLSVPVQRGVVTLIVLDPDEAIAEVGVGLGGDCSKPEAVWCIAAQPGGRHVFVKAKTGARADNTLAVVTDRRVHNFQLQVVDGGRGQLPVYRLTVRAPVPAPPSAVAPAARPLPPLSAVMQIDPATLVADRLQAQPAIRNTAYSIAQGAGSEDILPSLIFDDGRFTYLRFAGNREVPAVFQVLGDGREALVNVRMEGDLLVVDRVARRLTLRAGQAVVAVWNDAFDLDGMPPTGGTTVPGVLRRLKGERVSDPVHDAPVHPPQPLHAPVAPATSTGDGDE